MEQGAEIILNLSASPFSLNKQAIRREMVSALAQAHNRPICYCNAVGGNDQLVFDGNSIAVNAKGELIAQLPGFRTAEEVVDTETTQLVELQTTERSAELFAALSLGVRDYLQKCGFKSAVLGLSGGIDSAVVAAIAWKPCAANVVGVSMPSRIPRKAAIDDALAPRRSRHQCHQIPIANAFTAFKAQFSEFSPACLRTRRKRTCRPACAHDPDVALEQIRPHRSFTGNKSELAVVIARSTATWRRPRGDQRCAKTMVWELARWMNRGREIIPVSTIEKPPSAELKPARKIRTRFRLRRADEILRLYVEET